MTKNKAALLCGILFGLGLTISQMSNPDKVLAFLDVTGNWDPSLAFVMGSVDYVGNAATFYFEESTTDL